MGSSDGTGSAARFNGPFGMAVDSAGNVYVADTSNDEIREITPSGVVTTLAGCAGQYGSSDGTGSTARFAYPDGVAVDSTGNVYVADHADDEIRKITPSGVVTTLAGSAWQPGSSDGTGSAARFAYPVGVALDSTDNVYVADSYDNEIRKISPSGVVTTLAGSVGHSGSSDGIGSAARFDLPYGVAVDSAGNVYVADADNDEIREITPSGVVTTLAGSAGQTGSSNGTGNAARFYAPYGVAVDIAGNVYVADANNNEIRRIADSAGLVSGDTPAFTETFDTRNAGTGKTLTVAGSVNDGNGGSNYTVTFVADTTGQITPRAIRVTAATSNKVYDGTTSPTATPTITSGSLVSGDTAAFAETFDTRNVGTGKTLTAAGSVNDGNGGSNYTVTLVAATAGSVTARPITVTAATSTKTYDGSASATVNPTITSGSLAAGDAAAFTETFDTRNVGTAKTLTAAGSVNDGNGGSNYAVTLVSTNTTGQITPRAITVTAASATKVYDGTATSTVTPAVTDVVTTLAGFAQTGSSDGTGSAAKFWGPEAVAVDSAGYVYVADVLNQEIRKISPSGVVTTLAGSAGQAGSSDGTGSAARFDDPEGVAVDSSGNVYVADELNEEVRKISPSGVVTTLAGSAGQTGSSNGTGSAARFYQPAGVAVDSAGNIYVADLSNDEIREITPSGVVTTLAGSAGQTGSSNGTGSAARFDDPEGVAVDNAGNVYVADYVNAEIRQINPSGIVTTLAGSAEQYGSSNGTGSAARFNGATGVAVDSAGNVYVADTWNDEIRKISPSGVVATLAGSPSQLGFADGTGSAASFFSPSSVAVDSEGNVCVADGENDEIRSVSPSGVVTTLAGIAGYGSSDGTGSAARFNQPRGVAADSAGNVYVADLQNDEIRKISPSGLVTTLAGSAGQSGSSNGTGSAARFYGPTGVAVDSAGNVYVADDPNQEIRKISPSGVVTTLAGSAGQTGSSDGTGAAARFFYPNGVAVDSAGNVYVADGLNQEIRKISPSGVVTTLAGSAGQAGSSDGTGSAARFDDPEGVAADSAGDVYVAESGNDEIRKITPSGVVTTLAGSAGQTGSSDGTGSAARFDIPNGVAVDGAGNVYVADSCNDEIRKITPSGVVTTLFGSAGKIGSSDGTGRAARFYDLQNVAADIAGNVYVADTSNDEIRLVSGNLVPGDTAAFTESFNTKNVGTGATLNVAGSVNDGNGGSNYTLTFVANTSGTIAARAITVTAAPNTKPYDGTTSAAATPAISAGTLVSGDTAAFSESYASKNAGAAETLLAAGSVNDGAGGSNYAVTFLANTSGAIAARPITVTAVTATKLYDGTTASTVAPSISAGSLAAGDTAAFSATFDTRNVGTGKTLFAAGSVNDGNSGSNYTVTLLATSATGTVTARAITVAAAAATKVYDGTTSSTVAPSITSGSLAAGDASAFSETFDTRNVGTAKTLTAAGSVNDGNGGSNYTVTLVATNTAGAVTPRAITVGAAAGTKVYDGTTSSTLVPAITSGSLAAGDTATFSETFDTRNAGAGKTLTASGSPIDGNGGSNYSVTFAANTTGQIAARPITVTAAADSKGYDGTITSTAAPAITAGSLVLSDTAAWSESFDTKNAGTGKTLFAAGSLSDGNGGNNYAVTFLANTTGAIAARAITVMAVAATKVYDGTTAAAATPAISGGSLAAGDTAAFRETFDNRNVGAGKTLTAAGSVADGNGGANYRVSWLANASGAITSQSNPYLNLANGVTTDYIAHNTSGSVVQIPVRINNLLDAAGDQGLTNVDVNLIYSSEVNMTGATESGNVVTVTTASPHGLTVGQSVMLSEIVGTVTQEKFNTPVSSAGLPTLALSIASVPSSTTFTFTDSTTGLGSCSGGVATASIFDLTKAPTVAWGPLVPSGWTTTVGTDQNGNLATPAGTVQLLACNSSGNDVTHTDPTQGGISPNGNILAYVSLPIEKNVSLGSTTSVINDDQTACGQETALISSIQFTGNTYPTLDPAQNATVQIVSSTTQPAATISVGSISSATGATSYSVPVMFTRNTPGGSGFTSAGAIILFDPNYIDPASITISAGDLLPADASWSISTSSLSAFVPSGGIPSVDTEAINLTALSTIGNLGALASNSTGSLWVINFTTVSGISSGSTVLNLVLNANGIHNSTNLSDFVGAYALSPAPTVAATDSVNGTVAFGDTSPAATTTTVTSSDTSAVYGTPVTFTAIVSALTGGLAPAAGSVDFVDTTTNTDLGDGTFQTATGVISTWTLTTGVKTFNVTTGDTITASYTPGSGFLGSSGTTIETVTALPITVTATTNSKVYDGTTSAVATPTITPALVAGDTATFAESYATRSAGSGLTLAVSGSLDDGNGGSNYAVTFTDDVTSQITPRDLSVTATAVGKVYDGTTSAAAVPTIAGGLASGDTAAFSESYDNRNAGSGKTLIASGSVDDGNGGSNYAVTFTSNTAGQITARAIGVTAVDDYRQYDGFTDASASPTVSSGTLAAGDTTAFTESFTSKNAMVNNTLNPAGSVNDGNGGNNYTVTWTSVSSYYLSPRAIGVTAVANSKVYDGTTSAAAIPTIASGSLATGDTLAFSETYNTTAAGTGLTLTPAGSVNDGNGGNNYSVDPVFSPVGVILPKLAIPGFVVTTMPTTTTAGNSFIVVVTLEDASHDTVTSYNGTVTLGSVNVVTWQPGPLPGGPINVVSGVGYGLASLTTAGDWDITATDGTYSGTATTAITVTPAAASQLVFDSSHEPLSTSAGLTMGTVDAALEDPYGNLVTSGASNVTVSIASGPNGGTLLGTTTVAAAGGVASFSNLFIDQAGAYAMAASAAVPGGVFTATSNPFTITPGTATQLAFTTPPANTPGSGTLLGSVGISAASWNATSQVVSITTDATHNLTNGAMVTVTGVSPTSYDGTYTVTVTSPTTFTYAMTTNPGPYAGGGAVGTPAAVAVAVEDTYGNTVTGDTSQVSLSLNTLSGDGVLVGTQSASVAAGVATFSNLAITRAGSYTLTATDSNLIVPLTTSPVFNTTLIVTNLTWNSTGFVATFSQPFDPTQLSLYGSPSTGYLPANVTLINSAGKTVRGSLLTNSTDTQFTFVATTLVSPAGLPIVGVSVPGAASGVLPSGTYQLIFASGTSAFTTPTGQLLDGDDSGTGGDAYVVTHLITMPTVAVVLPSFARGPGNTVNVTNASASIASTVSSSATASESGTTVTVTTATALGLEIGESVTITGMSKAAYNNTFVVRTVPNSTTFTFTGTSGTGAATGGTVTLYGISESGSTVTVNTAMPDALVANEPVTLSGVSVNGYNGLWKVATVTNNYSFTFTAATTGLGAASGGTFTASRGIPISLSNADGIKSGEFTILVRPDDAQRQRRVDRSQLGEQLPRGHLVARCVVQPRRRTGGDRLQFGDQRPAGQRGHRAGRSDGQRAFGGLLQLRGPLAGQRRVVLQRRRFHRLRSRRQRLASGQLPGQCQRHGWFHQRGYGGPHPGLGRGRRLRRLSVGRSVHHQRHRGAGRSTRPTRATSANTSAGARSRRSRSMPAPR